MKAINMSRLFYIAGMSLLCLSATAQEHSYAPSDIENGRGLYQANCLGCHGNTGDEVDGVRLSSGRFRRASADEELIALIRNGIPNTLMIAKPQLDYGDLRSLVAFIRSLQAGGAIIDDNSRDVVIGDSGRGEQLFFGRAECSTCHGVFGGGSPLYQDLAGIGAQRSAASLEDSMLYPDQEIREGERFYQVIDHQNQQTVGKLMNQDRHSVQLLTMNEKLESFMTEDLSEHGFTPSAMPAYLDVLSASEISDLVAYLLSLKE